MTNAPVVCPFCPLHCDDVVLDEQGNWAHADRDAADCDFAKHQFLAAVRPGLPRIGADAVQMSEWSALQARLTLPAMPTVEIHGATLEESKEIESMASNGAIQIRFTKCPSADAIDATVAREGMMAATLGDVCRHADLIWIVGDIQSGTTRLRKKLDASGARVETTKVIRIEDLARLHQRIAEMETDDGGQQLGRCNAEAPEQSPMDQLCPMDQLFASLRESRYTAVVIGEAAFESGAETASADQLFRAIARWNELAYPIDSDASDITARAVMMRFAADQNLRSVFRWRNNRVLLSELSAPRATDIRMGTPPRGAIDPVRLQIGGLDPGPETRRILSFPRRRTGSADRRHDDSRRRIGNVAAGRTL